MDCGSKKSQVLVGDEPPVVELGGGIGILGGGKIMGCGFMKSKNQGSEDLMANLRVEGLVVWGWAVGDGAGGVHQIVAIAGCVL